MTPSTPPYRIKPLAGVADHRRRLTDDSIDGDTTMHGRVSMDSSASTVLGEGTDAEEGNYAWTDEQVAILVRTLEDGCPPNVKKRTAPRTPYNAARPPDTLIDLWARQLKRYGDWPHNVREIRRMLKSMAADVARGVQPGRPKSRNADGDALMDYEETRDETGFGGILDSPPPARSTNVPAGVLRSSIRLQRLDRDLDIQPVSYHPYLYARPRSPLKTPRSPSVEPISPTESYFPGSPSYNSASRPRSRSVSPGSDGPRPNSPTVSSRHIEPLSLSPMRLSPHKPNQARTARSPDPADLLATFSSEASGSRTSGKRAPLPDSFFSKPVRNMLQPAAQLQADGFFSTNAPLPSGRTEPRNFSSISSVSSVFSNQSSAVGSPTRPSHSPSKQQSIPYIPPLSVTHPHLNEAHGSRGGIKRSASFSRPADPIKRAPSYPSISENSKLRLTHSPPETNIVPEEPVSLLGHKRERSETSFVETESEYDTEDVPPSSAPSSDVIPPVSPLKAAFNPSPPKSPRKGGPSPHKLLQSSKLLASPRILGGRLFSRKKGGKGKSAESSDVERDRTTSPSPTPSPFPRLDPIEDRDVTLSPITPSTPGRRGMDLDRLLLSPDSFRAHSDRESSVLSYESTPRSKVMSTPHLPVARHKTSAELRTIRQSPVERREGEPRRKRVKTDELTTPPRLLRSHVLSTQNGHQDHTPETPRPASRALSDTGRRVARTPPRRVRATALSASRTPPRRSAKSPRLLPGGGRAKTNSPPVPPRPANPLPTLRLTASPPPLNNMAKIVASLPPVEQEDGETPRAAVRQRVRSGMASAAAAGSGGASSNPTTAKEGRGVSTRGTQRPASPVEKNRARRAVGESTTKARSTAADTSATKVGMSATVGRTAGRTVQKRTPSFLGPELVLKQPVSQEPMDEAAVANRLRRVGTQRFPAVSTASISSVLFPDGPSDLPSTQLDTVQESSPTNATSGNGDEGVAQPAQIRRQTPSRDTLRSGPGPSVGFGRARMTRSISMLGPGEKPRPY